MASAKIDIDRNILMWAINRSGKDIDAFLATHPNVQKWIDGTSKPTLNKLEEMAKSLYVPLGYLFLNTPPEECMPIPLFRRNNNRMDINVYDTICEMQDRQEWLSGYLQQIGMEPISFMGIHTPFDNVTEVCNTIRKLLDLSTHWALESKTVENALNRLTEILENIGIVVSFNSVVGNNTHRPIKVSECRGFVLVNHYAPFIFVNSKDAKCAQIFTLIHEFVHILINKSAGIGDYELSLNDREERFCDMVAAEFLLPKELLLYAWQEYGEQYDELSKRLKLSRFVIARCAKDYGFITEDRFFSLYNNWSSESYEDTVTQSQGGNFYATAIKRTSRTFLIHINNAIDRNLILYTEAFRLTGLKGDTYRDVISSRYFVKTY